MAERVDLEEFVGGFIAESEQLVASATAALLDIEQANARGALHPRTVRDLFRTLHTLKGLAGMMGIAPIVELAHAFETVVRAADRVGGRLGPRAVELGLLAIRAIAERVRAVADKRAVPPAPEAILAELARVEPGATMNAPGPVATAWDDKLDPSERAQLADALAAGRPAYALTFTPSHDHTARGVSIASVRARVAEVGQIVKVTPRSDAGAPAGIAFDLLVISSAPPAQLAEIAATTADPVTPLAAQPPAAAKLPELPQLPDLPELPADEGVTPIRRSFVRVELERLDELQEQLSGLIVSRFRLEHELAAMAAAGQDVRRLRELGELLSRQLRELRHGILRARLVRVAEVLEPLSLLVRSMSRPGVKEVRLGVDVGDTELDKAVADRLLPAIVHLVRNAIDHAIEPVAERERLGKPRAGKVCIACREAAGNRLALAIEDDGRGIDREAVAQRAGRAVDSDDDLLAVLATPGFSTRAVATETSGRGLGMDIVRRAVSSLGGELALATQPGKGTTFTLRVPLTIAIMDVFSFECAHQPFAVPVAMVEEIFDLGERPAIDGPTGARSRLPVRLCQRRGCAVPVIALATLLRLGRADDASKVLVVRRAGQPLAFAVDRMLGRHEVVVRPVADPLARAPGIAGATDLGDGRPTLLLDLVELGAGVGGWREEVPA